VERKMDRFKIIVQGLPDKLKHLEQTGITIPWIEWEIMPHISCFYYAYKMDGDCKVPLYTGETGDLHQRVPSIHRQSIQAHNEAQFITYFSESDKKVRIINRDILGNYFRV
jgi:hypothetical protein